MNTETDSLWQKDLATTPLDEAGVVVRALQEARTAGRQTPEPDDVDADRIAEALANHRALSVRAAQQARLPTAASPSQLDDHGASAFASDVTRVAAQERGRAAHAYLALVDLSRHEVDDDVLAHVTSDAATRAELRRWLVRFHASEVCARLRDAAHVEREIAVTYRDGEGHVVHGVIDMLWKDAHGTWQVIDWKTDRDPDSARHAAQLAAYAQGVQRALGLPRAPSAEAVFLGRGGEGTT